MSLYFEFETTSEYDKGSDPVVRSCWSSGDSPLLSVAHRSGIIKFYNEEVSPILCQVCALCKSLRFIDFVFDCTPTGPGDSPVQGESVMYKHGLAHKACSADSWF